MLKRSSLAAVLLVLAAPFLGTASAAETSAPAAVSWNSNRYDLFVRGEDGLIYHKYWNGSSWIGWGTIGAPPVGAASSPTVATGGWEDLQVFVRGGDNRIWMNHYLHGSGGWTGWGAIPNTGNATWAPAATTGPDQWADVFYTGTDGSIHYTRYVPYQGWTYPMNLGGAISGSPGATTTAGGRLEIGVKGTDNRLYMKFADSPNGWTPWGWVTNAWTSMSPAVTTDDAGRLNFFFSASHNNSLLLHQYWNGGGWTGPGVIPNASLITSSPAAARLHVYYRNAAGGVMDTWYNPASGWTYPKSLGHPGEKRRLMREQNSGAVFYVVTGTRYWVASPEVANAAGFDLNTVEVVPPGSFNSVPRGQDLTMADIGGWEEPDPGTATAANGWSSAWGDTDDDFEVKSADNRARAYGTVKWFYGSRKPWLHRGIFSSSSYVASYGGNTPCIWAQVTWHHPTGSVGFPPSGSVSGAEKRSNMFVKCRSGGYTAPDAIPLYGLGYAYTQLGAATITVCSSNSRAEGPRHCANHKVSYPVWSP